jgi:hypothetical protein
MGISTIQLYRQDLLIYQDATWSKMSTNSIWKPKRDKWTYTVPKECKKSKHPNLLTMLKVILMKSTTSEE